MLRFSNCGYGRARWLSLPHGVDDTCELGATGTPQRISRKVAATVQDRISGGLSTRRKEPKRRLPRQAGNAKPDPALMSECEIPSPASAPTTVPDLAMLLRRRHLDPRVLVLMHDQSPPAQKPRRGQGSGALVFCSAQTPAQKHASTSLLDTRTIWLLEETTGSHTHCHLHWQMLRAGDRIMNLKNRANRESLSPRYTQIPFRFF